MYATDGKDFSVVFSSIYFRFTPYKQEFFFFLNHQILYSFYRIYFPRANTAEAQSLSTLSCCTEFRELAITTFSNLRRYIVCSAANRRFGFHVCTCDVRYSLVHTFVHYSIRYSPVIHRFTHLLPVLFGVSP